MYWVSKPLPGTPINQLHPQLRGLMLWYPLLEGGGTTVRNPANFNAYPGIFSGIGTSTTSGWRGGYNGGSSILFDGTDDNILTNTDNPFDFANTTFTVTGRFRTSKTAVNMYIFGKIGSGSTGGWGVGVGNDASNKFGVVVKNSGATSNCILRSSNTTVTDNKWHHFAAIITTDSSTSANNTATIYIDGALDQGTATISGTSDGSSSANLRIGNRESGNPFNGYLEDLRLYTRGLSANEVLDIHLNPWAMFQHKAPFYYNTVSGGAVLARSFGYVIG